MARISWGQLVLSLTLFFFGLFSFPLPAQVDRLFVMVTALIFAILSVRFQEGTASRPSLFVERAQEDDEEGKRN